MTNLLLLVFDDLRPLLGCYGDAVARTPHIDRLASRGMVFDAAYTPCPLCAPARASIFSGLRPGTHGVTRLSYPLRGRIPELVTWPQQLRRQGWRSVGAGKVFHKGVPDGVCQPDPVGGGGDPQAWDVFHTPGGMELSSNGTMRNYTPWETHTAGIGGAIAWLRAEGPDAKQHDHLVADAISREITGHDPSRPALWAAGFVRPHVPLVAPRRCFEALDSVDIPLPATRADATPLAAPVTRQWCSAFGLSDEQRREAIRAYHACVHFADEQVGRILDALEASGQCDETVIVLTSDHGFQLGEHGLWFKNFPFRESVQVPLVICDPRRQASHGRHCRALVDHCDIAPTVFELLGQEPPTSQPAEGRSLVGLLEEPDQDWRSGLAAVVDWQRVQCRSWRTREHLYLRWEGAHQQEQLFDLGDDPGEEVDLLHGGADHPCLAGMREALAAD